MRVFVFSSLCVCVCVCVFVHTFIIPFQLSPVETRNSVRKAIPKFSNVAWRLSPSHGLLSVHSNQQNKTHLGIIYAAVPYTLSTKFTIKRLVIFQRNTYVFVFLLSKQNFNYWNEPSNLRWKKATLPTTLIYCRLWTINCYEVKTERVKHLSK